MKKKLALAAIWFLITVVLGAIAPAQAIKSVTLSWTNPNSASANRRVGVLERSDEHLLCHCQLE